MNRRLTRLEAWGLTALLLLAAALALRQGTLALLGAGLLATAWIADVWQRYALRAVEYRREVSERRAFFGEELALVVELTNRKPLPLPWLEADDSIPAGLDVLDGPAYVNTEPGRSRLRQVLPLGWYERVRLRYRLRCAARGAFTLGPVRLRSGDPFGFVAREATLPVYDRLLVYPRVVPIEALGLPARHPFGDIRQRRRLFEDQTRLAGVRPYSTDDSPRHIHWKASARLQQLQTRVYEATTQHTLMLYVNLASFEGFWWASLNRDLLEQAILAAASVASWAAAEGYRVGVATNGAAAGDAAELSVAPAGTPQHLVTILDCLARISVFARTPLEQLLARDRTRLPWGSTVVVVSAVIAEPVERVLLSLASAGHVSAVLQIGRDGRRAVTVPTYVIPADVPWHATESLAAVRG